MALHQVIAHLQETVNSHQRRIEELEARLNRNSSNSSRPPSSDPPFHKEHHNGKHGKPGGKKGHKGHRQVMLDPTEVKPLKPKRCSCGNTRFPELTPFCTHQFIELPEIRMEVTHFVLHKGVCPCCGKVNKASLPAEYRAGFGAGLSAMIAQLAGNQGDSRTLIQECCTSVLGFPISPGAIQKIIDRGSAAIAPHYEALAQTARTSDVAHIDETTFSRKDVLQWLWVMATSTVAFFMIHRRRSKAAFEALVRDWDGILVSDGYKIYCNNNHAERMLRFAVIWRKRFHGTASEKGNRWVERILSLRQTCRFQSRRLYPILVDAISAHFQGTAPSLAWIPKSPAT